jgi:hypothetical protein
MHMLMVVFRASLKERVYELLDRCHVKAFTEVNETVGYGQTGPAEGLAFYPGTNSVIFVALNPDHAARVARVCAGGKSFRLGEAGPARFLLAGRADRMTGP